MPINELKLARELIRCPSVTPKDAGTINILTKNLHMFKMTNYLFLKLMMPLIIIS